MSLAEYRRKRKFDRTREPAAGLGRGDAPAQRAQFVVQLHHARSRHYDFRLQVGEVLKSWAVPKGPSFDPKVKRMAVEVEDHPLDYAGFEGEIPKGEYGGGHVAVFDRGVWWSAAGDVEQQLASGHLRFELFGNKLKGGWHLVRSKKPARQPQWLLFKADDAHASDVEADDLLADVTAPPQATTRSRVARKGPAKKSQPQPRVRRMRTSNWTQQALALDKAKPTVRPSEPFNPQLTRQGDTPPAGDQWLHELKWDGYRILAVVSDGAVRLWSRNALEWTDRLPDICAAIAQLGLGSAAFDGELIAARGAQDDFNLLQATLAGERHATLSYVVFDLLHLEGVDIAAAPLIQRKQLLAELMKPLPAHLAVSSHVQGEGRAAFELAVEQGFEGLISKRADQPYRPGRSDSWRKTRQRDTEEFAVVGFTAAKGSRAGFGALLLAAPDREHGWRYAGRVGSGFDDRLIRELDARLQGGSKKPSVHVPTMDSDLRRASWFKPRFVVEVFYRGIGGQGLLRQPSLKTVRVDKDIADLADSRIVEAPMSSSSSSCRTNPSPVPGPRARKSSAKTGKSAPSSMPKLSSPDKLLFPDIGVSKKDVWDYYSAVMDQLLPEIAGRPLSVIRCPGGIESSCFFQKHEMAGLSLASTVRLKEKRGHAAEYLVVEDAAAVMELVQFNALEFHPWGARASSPDLADRVVFDLDPGPGVGFAEIKKAAQHIRQLLQQIELESFVRVTGGKGLHVVVPLNPGCDWGLTKRFAHGFADALARSQPDRFLAKASKKLRDKRIFIDYLRNSRGATAVASYSLRARPGAPVAMPMTWSDLTKLKAPDTFTLAEVPAKLKRRRKEPWAGIDDVQQNLAQWEQAD